MGLRWIFVNLLKWVQSGSKLGFWVQKWVKTRRNPLFTPFSTHFGRLTKPMFDPLYAGWKLFSKKGPEAVPTQHKSQHEEIGCDTPPRSMRTLGAIPPYKRSISAILARYHMKTKENMCDTPCCNTTVRSEKSPTDSYF